MSLQFPSFSTYQSPQDGSGLLRIIVVGAVVATLIACGDSRPMNILTQIGASEENTISRKLHGHIVLGNITDFRFFLEENEQILPWVIIDPKDEHKKLTIHASDGIYIVESMTSRYGNILIIARYNSNDNFRYIYYVHKSEVKSNKSFELAGLDSHLGAIRDAVEALKSGNPK